MLRQARRELCFCEQHRSARIFEHEGEAFARKRRVEWEMGRARFEDAEQCDDHLCRTFNTKTDQRLRPHPARCEKVRQTICTPIQFRKRQPFLI